MADATPRPWHVETNALEGTDDVGFTILSNDEIVCDLYQHAGACLLRFDNDEANARLIAAAPDMLADHQENARVLGFLVNELQGRIDGGKLAALCACLNRSNAAIAKATE
jgi:hypothetical protein